MRLVGAPLIEEDGIRVQATMHAAQRTLLRIEHLRGCHRDSASHWAETHVLRAIKAGRKARRCPRWCNREYEEGLRRRGRASRTGMHRFVWDEYERAAFVVLRRRDEATGKPVWLILTVIARVDAAS